MLLSNRGCHGNWLSESHSSLIVLTSEYETHLLPCALQTQLVIVIVTLIAVIV
jgi:hypothetical protein